MKNKKVKQEVPDFKVLKVTECENGDALIDYQVNDAFVDLVRQDLGKNKVTNEEINNWILKALTSTVKEAQI